MKKRIFALFVAIACLLVSNLCMGSMVVDPSNEDDVSYCGGGDFAEESETITYATKETTEYKISSEVPNYYAQMDATNCANVAGAVLIGYYDRFCEDLIPDYKTYIQIGSAIKYRVGTFETEAVVRTLYNYMDTDIGAEGTTYAGFHKGMRKYVNEKNYTYSYTELGNFNFNNYVSAVEANKPVAIFLLDYSLLVTGSDTGTVQTINTHHGRVAHVVIGYGYKIDTYYNSNNQVITTRTYLRVASGFVEYGSRYLCLNGKSTIENAAVVVIS